MPEPSKSHLVVIPSYNPGDIVYETVAAARRYWGPVWVVVDGSTDGTGEGLQKLAQTDPALRVIVLTRNQGKGAAILAGLKLADAAGYSHALTMDSDGQHPAALIPTFMKKSQAHPTAMVLGIPVFDSDAPKLRVYGRRISNRWARLETPWAGIGDSLFGFRVYPIAPLRAIMSAQRGMRRFDFDAEAVVRMSWRGVPAINLPATVRYIRPDEGGVSQFRYFRDNTLLTWMHIRLFFGLLIRLPILLKRHYAPQAIGEKHD
ncbi:MAG: glycosyltransferase family 2 protein [Acidiferrobacter sp.]